MGALSKISFEELTSMERPVFLTKFIGASKVDSFPVTNPCWFVCEIGGLEQSHQFIVSVVYGNDEC